MVQEDKTLLEKTHYYPFGLVQRGISSQASGALTNKKKYNGKEEQRQEFSDGSGLDWLDYEARFYDEQIGRWHVQDVKAWKYATLSSYSYANNMPVNAIDIHGEDIYIISGNKVVKYTIETLRKTDIGRKLIEKYENSETNDIYISVQRFKIRDGKYPAADAYTTADIESEKGIGIDSKVSVRKSMHDKKQAIEFSSFERVDVSKSKGKQISLVTLSDETFNEKIILKRIKYIMRKAI